MKLKYYYIVLLMIMFASSVNGQRAFSFKSDTLPKTKNPKTASIMSAIIPGLGQVYNEQYWKVPIIYGGFGTMMFFIKFNDKEYQKWQKAYQYRVDDDSTTIDRYPMASDDQLKKLKNEWRRNRDLNYIGIVVLYFMNVIDASVDAHLFDYDISDDLSLHIEPAYIDPRNLIFNPNKQSYPIGIKCAFRF